MLININHPIITSIEVKNITEFEEVLKLFNNNDKNEKDVCAEIKSWLEIERPVTMTSESKPLEIRYDAATKAFYDVSTNTIISAI